MASISVIIAAYNAENTIVETITSVLNQTHQDLEVIAIDDGSSDATGDRVRSFQDPRVKLFSYENGGVAKARNRGIERATGEYISFLDHDDLWTKEKLADQLTALERSPDAGVAYSWTMQMYSDENPVRFLPLENVTYQGNVYQQLLLSNFINSASNILVRRAAIESTGEFDRDAICNEDWDYYLRLAAKWQFTVVPQYQIFYRQTANSMSSQVERLERGSLVVLEKARLSAPDLLQTCQNRILSNLNFYYARLYLDGYLNIPQVNALQTLKNAYRTLAIAIYLFPVSLGQKTTWKLLFKLLLASILPGISNQQLQKAQSKSQWIASRFLLKS